MITTLLLALTLSASAEDGHAAEHGAAHGDHATVTHRFDDPEQWSKVFDDPERDAWQQPEALVGALDLHKGQVVADIGAGTGYFNARLSKAVGKKGKVVAVDIEPNLVQWMAHRAETEKTRNVEARLGAPDDPRLADGEVDVVMMVDTYHHIDGRTEYFGRLRGTLRPGGRLVVVDFKKGEIPVGPPEAHHIAAEQVTAELNEAGWSLLASPDVLPYQFVQVYAVTGPTSAE